MASRCSLGLLGLALVLILPLNAGAAPPETIRPPIRDYDLRTLEQFGGAIYRQDRAAWLATDAVVAKVPDLAKEQVVGWIVEGEGANDKVRFLRETAMGLEAGFDVTVTGKGAGPVETPTDRSLTAEERAAFAARRTAVHALTSPCRPRYNSAVIKDPNSDGWLVWLLAPGPAQGALPVGGHYRVFVSADGGTVKQVDALSATCLVIDPRRGLPPGATPMGAVVSHLVSPTPIETHVFLNLLYRLPLYVEAGGRSWIVANGKIKPRK